MPFSPEEGGESHLNRPITFAELFCRFPNHRLRQELEEFRVDYENKFGPTDLTRRWTTTLSKPQQDWLAEHEPKRYWDGFPPFVQAYIKEKMKAAHRAGKVDDMPGRLLNLYLNGRMEVDGREWGR
jgi:hypothetical protein